MILSKKLLKSKDLTPVQKLVMGLILNESPVIMKIAGGYLKTCGEMGKEIGLSRDKVRAALDDLVVKEYVVTEFGRGWRKTNLTAKCDMYKI